MPPDVQDIAYPGGEFLFAVVGGLPGENRMLLVVDVSTPADPRIVGNFTDPSLYGARFVESSADGNTVLVLSNTTEFLVIVDTDDKEKPKHVGSFQDKNRYKEPGGLALSGEYAFITSRNTSSLAIEHAPGAEFAGTVDLPEPGAVAVSSVDPDLAVVLSASGLLLVNVSYKDDPQWVDTLSETVVLDEPAALALDEEYAYVVSGGDLNALAVVRYLPLELPLGGPLLCWWPRPARLYPNDRGGLQ